MTSSPTTEGEPVTRAAPDAAAAADERFYDPERERIVARRLKGGRRRRAVLAMCAVLVAAATAAGFTYTYQDMPAVTDAWAATTAAPQPEPPAATLASNSSAPVRLVQPDSDPNKRQERVATDGPGDTPASVGSAVSPGGSQPANGMTAMTTDGVRRIPLGPGPMADATPPPSAPAFAPSDTTGPATEMTMPLAPLPQPRPRRAP
ncbi:hypothetical protein [Phreatobacter sp. AB_2022a]|uniref:hypothetical protein n=1 Tax=Phreatobacter sp. AB_2022a TaxID=3003134 RepID=UPI0022871E80|nr:hypothetical protein [Phreatobacter sp. AB_2022a]MCZ0734025.1 hypothetical protein [Phreatobacter sp. AB_2022a]